MPSEVTDNIQAIFPGSVNHLSESVDPEALNVVAACAEHSVLMTVLAIVACLVFLCCLNHLAVIFPTMLGCLISRKEVLILEESARLSRYRNTSVFCAILPFLLICARYGLYPPAAYLPVNLRLLWSTAVFGAYLTVRALCNLTARVKNPDDSLLLAAVRMPLTFFCLLAIIMCVTVGVCSLAQISDNVTQLVLWWEMAILYAMCIIRKIQIFTSRRGFLAGFLYLCTLEFLPTGLLLASAFLL